MTEPPWGVGWWMGPDGEWHPPEPTAPSGPFNLFAIGALVFGILGFTCLPLVGAVIAVVAGHTARGQILRSDPPERGTGLAIAGLVLGYAVIGLAVVVLVGNLILQFV